VQCTSGRTGPASEACAVHQPCASRRCRTDVAIATRISCLPRCRGASWSDGAPTSAHDVHLRCAVRERVVRRCRRQPAGQMRAIPRVQRYATRSLFSQVGDDCLFRCSVSCWQAVQHAAHAVFLLGVARCYSISDTACYIVAGTAVLTADSDRISEQIWQVILQITCLGVSQPFQIT
jgi:hypothetical protein